MSSSVGSDVFAISALLAISAIVLLLLRYFLPLRSTPAFLLVPIFFALALPSSAVLLVPIDLASSAHTEDEVSRGVWLPQRIILIWWRITYWLTFVLTWFILPLLGEYMDAGYRDPKSRLIYSLRSNGRYQLIVLVCAVAGLVYMILSYGFYFTGIKGLVMALAYVWGLILAIYLMGHGLVALPRSMFRNADISGRLRRVQGKAPRVHEQLEDATAALAEIDAQIMQLKLRKTGTARDFQEWIDDLVELAAISGDRIAAPNSALDPSAAKVPAVITERYLAELTRRLARARHQRARYTAEWDNTVQAASDLQAVLDSKASKKLAFGQSPSKSTWSRISFMTPYMRYHLHVHIFPAFRIILGSMLSLASVAVIWSEIVRFPAPHLSAVSLTVIHRPSDKDYQIGFGGQLVAALWITYMCTCALTSVNDVPVWGQRALVPRNTYSEAACWYAGQIAKLTVPLAYNFLTFLPAHIHTETTFYKFLGRLINLTPLGKWFDYLFPFFILIPVCATLFNLYGRIKDVLGFGILEDEFDEENPAGFGTGGWREGRELIARDLEGVGGASLGLSDSTRPSLDTSRAAPARWVPPAERSSTTQSAYERSRLPPQPDPAEEDQNFFALFGRRVKNTIDTIDTPKWMPNVRSGGGLKRPKWMGGSDEPDGGQGSSQGPRLGSLGNIFGNGNRAGQIIL